MQPSANPLPDRCGHRTWPWPSRRARKVSASICLGETSAATSSALIVCVMKYANPTLPARTTLNPRSLGRLPGAESGEQQVNDMSVWCRELIRDRFGIEDLFCLLVGLRFPAPRR